MIVAKSANAQSPLQLPMSQATNRVLAELIQHIRSDAANPQLPWDQDLLRSILYQQTTGHSLVDIIRGKAEANKQEPSMLWTLLKLFASSRDAVQQVLKFDADHVHGFNKRDFSLRWLVQLTLMQSLHQQ